MNVQLLRSGPSPAIVSTSNPYVSDRARSKTCVVVDGNPVHLDLSRRLLQSAGIGAIVVGVSRCDEAIDYLNQLCRTISAGHEQPPLAIFLEINLPGVFGFDGFEMLCWIRGTPVLHPTSAVMLSSSRLPRHVARARSMGAAAYLIKHPPPATMRECLLSGFAQGAWPECGGTGD